MAVKLKFDTPLNTAHPVDLRFGAPLVSVDETNLSFNAVIPAPRLSGIIGQPIGLAFSSSVPAPQLTGLIAHSRAITLAASVPAPTLSGVLLKTREVQLIAGIPSPIMTTVLVYDNAVYRGPNATLQPTWQVADNAYSATEMGHQSTKPLPSGKEAPFQDAQKLQSIAQMPWQGNLSTRTNLHSRFQDGIKVGTATTDHQADMLRLRNKLGGKWQDGIKLGTDLHDGWQDRFRYPRPALAAKWTEAKKTVVDRATTAGVGKPTQVGKESDWQVARKPPAGLFTWTIPVDPPEPGCYTPSPGDNVPLLFSELFSTSADLLFRCGNQVTHPPGTTQVVPIRRTYIVLNESSLRRVDGNIPLPTLGMSISLDADSWTWTFSATLPGSALASLEPASAGEPVLVEALINGVAYRMQVEKRGRDRSFGQSAIKISGRGLPAMLDNPYAPVMNQGNPSAERTAQQLMNDVLTINGVSIGWTVDWQVDDWVVPAGTFSQQGPYIAALNVIAAAAGAYIQPHATEQTLHVLPRYPTAPWDWTTATPDFEIPSDVATVEGIEWVEKSAYNRVFVSGMQNGVLGQVTRAGTDGSNVAPMVTDALITTAAAARQRGLPVLADTGSQANVTLRMPVLAETGIIVPGKMIKYTDGATVYRGITRSVQVDVGSPEIWQTIGLETHA